MFGSHPYLGNSVNIGEEKIAEVYFQLRKQKITPFYPDKTSMKFKDMINHMLVLNYKKRYSAKKLLKNNSYLKYVRDNYKDCKKKLKNFLELFDKPKVQSFK